MTNKLFIYVIKLLRKIYTRKILNKRNYLTESEQHPDIISEIIYDALTNNEPCMIARFGAFEINTIVNYIGVKKGRSSIIKYIKGEELDWWWNKSLLYSMQNNAGFFPPTIDKIEQFCKLMLQDIPQVDILGSWQQSERYFEKELNSAQKVRLMYLDPFWTKSPWTKALKGKKILVVHPFAETIKSQYSKRELLFENQDILPEFASLTIIRAVQSVGKGDDRFSDWFEALEYMKAEIDKVDFDIALIGCGAYGFPLAAHVKRIGKKAVHIGGSLQLLFGIKGKRWENDIPHYVPPFNTFVYYKGLQNDYWVRPLDNEKPENHFKVENSCYW